MPATSKLLRHEPAVHRATAGFDDLQAARGFVISAEPFEPPHPEWAVIRLGSWHLAYDRRLEFIECGPDDRDDAWVAVLGHFVDTGGWAAPGDAVRVAADALARSERELLEVTDAWSGRYLVLYGHRGGTHLMLDATGMRSAFYNLEGPLVVASHPAITARAAGAAGVRRSFEDRPEWARGVGLFPGRLTPWDGVVFVTPNVALELESRRVRRLWPRGPLPERSVPDAAAFLLDVFSRQAAALVGTGRPVAVSLTAGLDSRVTVAATRAVEQQITYFTYLKPGDASREVDLEIATAVAGVAGLRHIVLNVPRDLGPAARESWRALAHNSYLPHARAVSEVYRRVFAADTIHVRSNVAEVGRRFYDKHGTRPPLTSAADMARLWKGLHSDEAAVGAFAEWAEAVGFWAVAEVDTLDLFYWEFRLPCWHGKLLLESDIAFDTHVLFNSRTVLEALLSVDVEARRTSQVLHEVVRIGWPELTAFPFNAPLAA